MFMKIAGTQTVLFVCGLLVAGFLSDVKWTVLGKAVGII